METRCERGVGAYRGADANGTPFRACWGEVMICASLYPVCTLLSYCRFPEQEPSDYRRLNWYPGTIYCMYMCMCEIWNSDSQKGTFTVFKEYK